MVNSEIDHQIKYLSQRFSAGVARENEANASFAKDHSFFVENCKSPMEYYEDGVSNAYIEYPEFLKQYPGKKLKILDIGVGRGESSVYLASLGHQVFSIEPSKDFCRLIAQIKNKFSLNITPVCSVAEEMGQLNESNFDLVIFNSSLHHCDNPDIALHQAYLMLKPNGKVFLSSEIQLKPWVNKSAWYRRLETHPEEMGHYGGNEHAYFNWEYSRMLKGAGFQKVDTFPSVQFLRPLVRIALELKSDRYNPLKGTAGFKYFLRIMYYFAASVVANNHWLFQPLAKLSLLPGQYVGEKL
ncbi:MAG: class I SAM-dependent methyltransferase [Bdellovibrionales bacterium]|nr:class I SAM-dependent methyltransferase [Bdellovibrionales bacterium]